MELINPVTLGLVKSALDAGTLRQAAHANNIANAGTEGYRPFGVVFEEELSGVREAINSNHGAALSVADISAPRLEQAVSAQTVNADTEVASMSMDALNYQVLARVLSKQLSLTGMALSDGKR